eukprot:gene25562-32032_t
MRDVINAELVALEDIISSGIHREKEHGNYFNELDTRLRKATKNIETSRQKLQSILTNDLPLQILTESGRLQRSEWIEKVSQSKALLLNLAQSPLLVKANELLVGDKVLMDEGKMCTQTSKSRIDSIPPEKWNAMMARAGELLQKQQSQTLTAEEQEDVAAILIGSLLHATTKVTPPDHTPAVKKQRVSHLIGDDFISDSSHTKNESKLEFYTPRATPHSGNASVLLDAIYGVYNHSEQPVESKTVVHRIPEDSDDYHSPSENDHDHDQHTVRRSVTHEAVSRLGNSKNAAAPQYNNNYFTYNIQLPPKIFHGAAPPVSAARSTPLSRHLSKKDRFELVQRAQLLEQQRPSVRGLQSLLAAEFDVCPTTVYHILKSRERVESEYYEQLVRLSRQPNEFSTSQSSTSLGTHTPSEIVLPEELSPCSASPLDVSTASGRLRMYEAYQPDIQCAVEEEEEEVPVEAQVEGPSVNSEVMLKNETEGDAQTVTFSAPSPLSSAEAVAQQVAIMSRFEEIVSEQLDTHKVLTTAEAHKYTEWYAAYYGIKTLEGAPWHCTDDWFERFNAVYMDGRFVE